MKLWNLVLVVCLVGSLSWAENKKSDESGKEIAEKKEEVDEAKKQVLSPEEKETIAQAEKLEKAESVRLRHYKPMYFAYGNPLTKAQFSFKSLVYEEVPLYIAYSQIIFWEMAKDSKPFLDATYNPEIFYTQKVSGSSLRSIDFGVWEHNSNGKDGLVSRSFNQSSVRLNYSFEGRKWVTQFSAKLKYIYANDDTNRDISDYISPLDFDLKILNILESFLDHTEFDLTFHPGGKYAHDWDKGGYQFGLQFHIGGIKVVPAFYLQYYSGYAETLLNYDQRVSQFRAGIVF